MTIITVEIENKYTNNNINIWNINNLMNVI